MAYLNVTPECNTSQGFPQVILLPVWLYQLCVSQTALDVKLLEILFWCTGPFCADIPPGYLILCTVGKIPQLFQIFLMFFFFFLGSKWFCNAFWDKLDSLLLSLSWILHFMQNHYCLQTQILFICQFATGERKCDLSDRPSNIIKITLATIQTHLL